MGIRNGCGGQKPVSSSPSRPAGIRIFTTDGRFDCVHHRDRISRGWPILNGIDHIKVVWVENDEPLPFIGPDQRFYTAHKRSF